MMNIKEYIESGVLELYCTGNLSAKEEAQVLSMTMHPDVRDELTRIQSTIKSFSFEHAITPPASVKIGLDNILDNLELEAKMNPEQLPLINQYSDYRKWLELVQDEIPTEFTEERVVKVLTHTPDLMQAFVISTTEFEDEVHTDEYESFLILQGTCECTVGDTVRNMVAGEFMAIPLHEHHSVKMTTPFVVAIMQRKAV